MSLMNSWLKKLGPHTSRKYSWWWETSMQELERTIQEEKGPWAPKTLDASITTLRDFLTYVRKITSPDGNTGSRVDHVIINHK